jgi:hypothetical protein
MKNLRKFKWVIYVLLTMAAMVFLAWLLFESAVNSFVDFILNFG